MYQVRILCVYHSMPSKRFNMWMEDDLIIKIKAAAKLLGLKAAPYIRIAILEKLGESKCHAQQLTDIGPKTKTR